MASLKGKRFGVVVVIRDHDTGRGDRKVRVICDCGEESLAVAQQLVGSGGRKRCSVSGCTDRRRAPQNERKASA